MDSFLIPGGFGTRSQDRTITSRKTAGGPRPDSVTQCSHRSSRAHLTWSVARSTPTHGLCIYLAQCSTRIRCW